MKAFIVTILIGIIIGRLIVYIMDLIIKRKHVKIYIAGPIAANKNYKENFENAHFKLMAKGYYVENPVREGENLERKIERFRMRKPTYEEYMENGLKQLKNCDAIYMLKGWKKSLGANRELGYALGSGKFVMFEDPEDAIDVREVRNRI